MDDVLSAVETLRNWALAAPLVVLPGIVLVVLLLCLVRGRLRERREEALWRER